MNMKNYPSAIPTIFTLLNLLFGFLSLVSASEKNFRLAAGLILLSVLMDTFDGKVARKLSVSSAFGKELDSLCDVVSFGVAPAFLIYHAILQPNLGTWGVIIASLFVLCGAARLARFNILNITTHFLGVPITFAGGLMALMMLFYDKLPWVFFPISLLLLAFLMVSSFKVPKLGH